MDVEDKEEKGRCEQNIGRLDKLKLQGKQPAKHMTDEEDMTNPNNNEEKEEEDSSEDKLTRWTT